MSEQLMHATVELRLHSNKTDHRMLFNNIPEMVRWLQQFVDGNPWAMNVLQLNDVDVAEVRS